MRAVSCAIGGSQVGGLQQRLDTGDTAEQRVRGLERVGCAREPRVERREVVIAEQLADRTEQSEDVGMLRNRPSRPPPDDGNDAAHE